MAISFKRHILKNGLRLIVHEDHTTPLASCFIAYNVGSKCEDPNITGLAHLLEHYMFSGSVNIPDYDTHLQKIGAINNAYTTQDFTCYYINLPAINIETALWLESDRMLSLAFNQKELDIQKSVVMEEFKEVLLNRPYCDMWSLFSELNYKVHPYQWNTIGKELSHIEKVTMDDVKNFYNKFYHPNNAVITIAGNVHYPEVVNLVEKWFGDIPSHNITHQNFPQELPQTKARILKVERDVPNDILLKGWKMCGRTGADYYAFDLLSDLLGTGRSSYLYKNLVIDKKIFSDITACITGNCDPGLWLIQGRPKENIRIEDAEAELSNFLYHFKPDDTLKENLQKVKNRAESMLLYNEIKTDDRASALALSEIIDSVEMFETEKEKYFAVPEDQIISLMNNAITEDQSSTLLYCAI